MIMKYIMDTYFHYTKALQGSGEQLAWHMC